MPADLEKIKPARPIPGELCLQHLHLPGGATVGCIKIQHEDDNHEGWLHVAWVTEPHDHETLPES